MEPFKDNWAYIFIFIGGFGLIVYVAGLVPNKWEATILAMVLLMILGFIGSYMFGNLFFDERQKILSWFGTFNVFSSLIPIGFFIAGPIIDIINGQYKYALASIVSVVTSLITYIVGSSTFTDTCKLIMDSVLPSLASVDGSWILRLASLVNVWFISAVIIFIAVPSGLTAVSPQAAQLSASVLTVVYGLVSLSGLGYLGNFSSESEREELKSRLEARSAKRSDEARRVRAAIETVGGSNLDYSPSDDKCDLPGFTWLSNSLAPISVIISQTIIWCHLIESWDTGNGKNTIVLSVVTALTFFIQSGILYRDNCLTDARYRYGWKSVIIGLIVSIVGAGTAYGVIKRTTEGFTPQKSGVFSNPTPEPTKIDPSKIRVGGSDEKNLPLNDEDQFVCEAYKDGELVTSTIVS